MGAYRQRAGARLRRCHAGQLRLASRGEQPDPEPDLGSLSLGLQFLNQIPILYTVLAFILIIGVIYYGLFETRKNIQVHIPAETGAVEIPPESLPPTSSPEPLGPADETTSLLGEVEAPHDHTGAVAPEQVSRELDRPVVSVEGDALDKQQRAPRATPSTWAA